MSTLHSDAAIDSLLDIESRLGAFLRVVPPQPEHNRVHSPVLASVLLDTCSLLETTLKSAMDNTRYDSIPNIANIRAKRTATVAPYMNIGDLRAVFTPDGFRSKPVWYLHSGDKSVPFYAWSPTTNRNPRWWGAYNKVKHHRFENGAMATLKETLHAAKGLFLVVVQCLDFRLRLVERGIIRSRTLSTRVVAGLAVKWEPFPHTHPDVLVAATSLFGYKFATTGNPGYTGDISLFL